MTEPFDPEQVQKLKELSERNTILIYRTQSVFPFRIFPCSVSLNRNKVTVQDYSFFQAKEVQTVLIKDIVSVTTDETMMLSTLTLLDKAPSASGITATHLRKEEARKMRRLIEGLMIVDREGVDITHIENSQLLNYLESLGMTQS